MKKILIPIVAVSALAAATVPAVASAQSINQRQDMLERRIDMGVRNGSLTRGEAYRLRAELRDYPAAIVSLRAAVAVSPTSPDPWTDLANVYRLQGRTDAEAAAQRRADVLTKRLRS